MTDSSQRLRITFSCEAHLRYVSHLDLMRVWERVFKRARLPVAYTQGFSPHPKLALAAPLPVGTTSAGELLDVTLERPVAPQAAEDALAPQLPMGLGIVEIREVSTGLPSLQASVRAAEYEVEIDDDRSAQAWHDAIDALLVRDAIPWEHKRGDKIRRYDLRPLIQELRPLPQKGRLWMRLRNDEKGAGRPEQVMLAMGAVEPRRIHRLRLVVDEPANAHSAYRASGRFHD